MYVDTGLFAPSYIEECAKGGFHPNTGQQETVNVFRSRMWDTDVNHGSNYGHHGNRVNFPLDGPEGFKGALDAAMGRIVRYLRDPTQRSLLALVRSEVGLPEEPPSPRPQLRRSHNESDENAKGIGLDDLDL